LKSGAILAKADTETASHLYTFGEQIGIAFQLRDDYLDAFGDAAKFGKQVGGDILADKKTYLWIRAHELASERQEKTLKNNLFSNISDAEKVSVYQKFFDETGARAELRATMELKVNEAMEHLHMANLNAHGRRNLEDFVSLIIHREV
jgi:geranylgeranyl diphosphate synthase type II